MKVEVGLSEEKKINEGDKEGKGRLCGTNVVTVHNLFEGKYLY